MDPELRNTLNKIHAPVDSGDIDLEAGIVIKQYLIERLNINYPINHSQIGLIGRLFPVVRDYLRGEKEAVGENYIE